MSDETTDLDAAHAALEDARQKLADVPAEVVITNHAMGLYELAAIHLSASTPNLTAATLAIDAMRALVEGVGDRLGDDAETMRHALANIQMAFVEVRRRTGGSGDDADGSEGATTAGETTDDGAAGDSSAGDSAAGISDSD